MELVKVQKRLDQAIAKVCWKARSYPDAMEEASFPETLYFYFATTGPRMAA